MQKKKKTIGYWVLNILSIILAAVFIGPIVWALAVSLQKEGRAIKSVTDWFAPPYTLENYPAIIMNSEVPTWLFNSLLVAVIVTVLTVIFSAMAAYAIAKLPVGIPTFAGTYTVDYVRPLTASMVASRPICPFDTGWQN